MKGYFRKGRSINKEDVKLKRVQDDLGLQNKKEFIVWVI